jgi:hypothetical protein
VKDFSSLQAFETKGKEAHSALYSHNSYGEEFHLGQGITALLLLSFPPKAVIRPPWLHSYLKDGHKAKPEKLEVRKCICYSN